MPIIIKGKKGTNESVSEKKHDMEALVAKRQHKEETRTKYHLARKERTPEEYKGIKLFVDGREMKLSDSAKFFLEQLIQDEEVQ